MIINNYYCGFAAAWRRILIVLACHFSADIVSYRKGSVSKGRTMETMPTKKQDDAYKARVKFYHGFCQAGAILSCIGANGIGTVWAPLFAIQISSFLMTLSHKKFNYGSETSIWEDFYNIALAVPYVYNFFGMKVLEFLGSMIMLFAYMKLNIFMNPRVPGQPTGFKFNWVKYAMMVTVFLLIPHERMGNQLKEFYGETL